MYNHVEDTTARGGRPLRIFDSSPEFQSILGGREKKVIHRLQTDRSGHLLNQPLEHFHAQKKARCQNITSLIALSDG